MYRIVLYTGVRFEIILVIALHPFYRCCAHHTGKIRVFTARLLATTPPRVTEYINIRTPEGETLMPNTTRGLCLSEFVMVGCIPYGTCFVRYHRVNIILLLCIECCSQRNGLGKYCDVVVADAMASLIPPIVSRNTKTVHRN